MKSSKFFNSDSSAHPDSATLNIIKRSKQIIEEQTRMAKNVLLKSKIEAEVNAAKKVSRSYQIKTKKKKQSKRSHFATIFEEANLSDNSVSSASCSKIDQNSQVVPKSFDNVQLLPNDSLNEINKINQISMEEVENRNEKTPTESSQKLQSEDANVKIENENSFKLFNSQETIALNEMQQHVFDVQKENCLVVEQQQAEEVCEEDVTKSSKIKISKTFTSQLQDCDFPKDITNETVQTYVTIALVHAENIEEIDETGIAEKRKLNENKTSATVEVTPSEVEDEFDKIISPTANKKVVADDVSVVPITRIVSDTLDELYQQLDDAFDCPDDSDEKTGKFGRILEICKLK